MYANAFGAPKVTRPERRRFERVFAGVGGSEEC